MSIVKSYVGRRARDNVAKETRRSHLSLSVLPASVSWSQAYLVMFALLLVALCYKLMVLWTVALLFLATGAWIGRKDLAKINSAFIVALLYIADATLTAFFVSRQAGIYRSAQFSVIAASLIGMFAYSFQLAAADARRILKFIGIVSSIIFVHMIIYHISSGRYITWKYLYDTKLVISLSVFLVFSMKDEIEKRVPFFVAIFALGILVIMSAERKALLLLVVLLFASNIRPLSKVSLVLFSAIVLAVVAGTGLDGGYLSHKLTASSADYGAASERYFSSVHNIDDFSDMIRGFTNRKAMQLFHEHPWFGVGATGYWQWAISTFGRDSGLAMNVHGEIHRIPAEGGIVGLIVVGAYVILIGWRVFHYTALRASRSGSSLERTPLYLFLYVICYAYGEAIDSAMLLLIGLSGVVAGRLPRPDLDVLVRRRRKTSAGAGPTYRVGVQAKPGLVRRLIGR